jgi:protein-S-isoprenylcysteine O-methyltransferase Ste14
MSWHMASTLLLGIAWATLSIVWIGGAAIGAAAPENARTRDREGFDPSWIVGGAAAWVAIDGLPGVDLAALTTSAGWARALGAALVLLATPFTVWARVALGRSWASGAVGASGDRLRTDGPYAVTRHPIYTGVLTLAAGSALIEGLGRWLLIVALVAILVKLKVAAEERLLLRVHDGRYELYRRDVPQLIPGRSALTALRRR